MSYKSNRIVLQFCQEVFRSEACMQVYDVWMGSAMCMCVVCDSSASYCTNAQREPQRALSLNQLQKWFFGFVGLLFSSLEFSQNIYFLPKFQIFCNSTKHAYVCKTRCVENSLTNSIGNDESLCALK